MLSFTPVQHFHSHQMKPSFTVHQSELQGNCVIATSEIELGDFVVHDEKPFVWSNISQQGEVCKFHAACGECGLVLHDQMFRVLAQTPILQHAANSEEILSMMKLLIPVAPSTNIQCSCGRECEVVYCSEACKHSASDHGHSWMCSSLLEPVLVKVQQLLAIDEKGHFGCAMKVYARIAALTLSKLLADNSIDVTSVSLDVAKELLAEYHYDDFARTMHSHRTGHLEIDPSIFDQIIFPAYFSAHLATPLALTKDIFAQSGSILWREAGEATAAAHNNSFMASEIFSDVFYSRIIGMFTVNSLSVYVPSPLDYILSEAIREKKMSVNNNTIDPAIASIHDPIVLQQIIDFLQTHLKEQQVELRQVEDNNADECDEGDVDGESSELHMHHDLAPTGVSTTGGHFLGASASGLFPLFSKTNHSCLSNTNCHGSDRVTVSIRASEHIACGAEITNCYIHHDTLNNNNAAHRTATDDSCLDSNDQHALNRLMTKKQRYRALRQYMFQCTCPLCTAQEIDSDEDSDC